MTSPATMAQALTASTHLIESLRLERDAAQAECAELRAALTEMREQIARDIEEYADDLEWTATVATGGDVAAVFDMAKDEIHHCAAIARGES